MPRSSTRKMAKNRCRKRPRGSLHSGVHASAVGVRVDGVGRVTGGDRMTEQAMNCGRRKLTLMNLKSATFAPIEFVWAYKLTCFAIRAGAKVADFCTSIDFLAARQNSLSDIHRPQLLASSATIVSPLPNYRLKPFPLDAPHSTLDCRKWVLSKTSPTGQSKPRYEIRPPCHNSPGKQVVFAD